MYALITCGKCFITGIFCTYQLVILLLILIVLQNQFFCTKGIVVSSLIYWERPDIGTYIREKKMVKRMVSRD
jgi:hypothetical protein